MCHQLLEWYNHNQFVWFCLWDLNLFPLRCGIGSFSNRILNWTLFLELGNSFHVQIQLLCSFYLYLIYGGFPRILIENLLFPSTMVLNSVCMSIFLIQNEILRIGPFTSVLLTIQNMKASYILYNFNNELVISWNETTTLFSYEFNNKFHNNLENIYFKVNKRKFRISPRLFVIQFCKQEISCLRYKKLVKYLCWSGNVVEKVI